MEDLETVIQHSALFPTQICKCNEWRIPVPSGDNVADVSVTVLVVAESQAGRSDPAELAFIVPSAVGCCQFKRIWSRVESACFSAIHMS